MTPLDIITRARQRMNASTDTLWSDLELYQYLQECETRLCEESRCQEPRYSATAVVGTQEYDYPTQSFEIYRVEFNSTRLMPMEMRDYDKLDINRSNGNGTPAFYYLLDGAIGLFPKPDSTGTIKVYSFDYPDLSTASSTLNTPAQYHWALILGVVSQMVPKELGHPNVSLFERRWEEAIRKVKRQERMRRNGDAFFVVQREEDQPLNSILSGG
jgi:hypothetical protein